VPLTLRSPRSWGIEGLVIHDGHERKLAAEHGVNLVVGDLGKPNIIGTNIRGEFQKRARALAVVSGSVQRIRVPVAVPRQHKVRRRGEVHRFEK